MNLQVLGQGVSLPSIIALVSAVVLGASLLVLLTRRAPKARHDSKPQSNGTVHVTTSSKDRCTILFGTQTGTAERFAKSLRSQLESKYGSHTAFEVLDIENYDGPGRLLGEKLVFFLMATYGDGEPTDSATEFYNWLSSSAAAGDQPDLLQVVQGGAGRAVPRQGHSCRHGHSHPPVTRC